MRKKRKIPKLKLKSKSKDYKFRRKLKKKADNFIWENKASEYDPAFRSECH